MAGSLGVKPRIQEPFDQEVGLEELSGSVQIRVSADHRRSRFRSRGLIGNSLRSYRLLPLAENPPTRNQPISATLPLRRSEHLTEWTSSWVWPRWLRPDTVL